MALFGNSQLIVIDYGNDSFNIGNLYLQIGHEIGLQISVKTPQNIPPLNSYRNHFLWL